MVFKTFCNKLVLRCLGRPHFACKMLLLYTSAYIYVYKYCSAAINLSRLLTNIVGSDVPVKLL